MIICWLLSRRHSLGDFSDSPDASLRAFSFATAGKHPVPAQRKQQLRSLIQ
jgi:hypothetical protein